MYSSVNSTSLRKGNIFRYAVSFFQYPIRTTANQTVRESVELCRSKLVAVIEGLAEKHKKIL